jgi:hypothetical protein
MIGHGAVFISALITSAAASLGLPTSTAPERCPTRAVPAQPMVRISVGRPQPLLRMHEARGRCYPSGLLASASAGSGSGCDRRLKGVSRKRYESSATTKITNHPASSRVFPARCRCVKTP